MTATRPARALLFDIDGTLIHSHGAGRRALVRAVTEWLGAPVDDSGWSWAGRTDVAILRHLFGRAGQALPENGALRSIVQRYLDYLSSELEAAPPEVYPGVRPLLNHLRGDPSWAVGLLTGNFREGARTKLQASGLWDHFSFGAYADDHEDRDKLVAVALSRIEELFGVALGPKRVVVVGDTSRDVACARAGGAWALGVESGFDPASVRSASPDACFDTLGDTTRVVDTLDSWTL